MSATAAAQPHGWQSLNAFLAALNTARHVGFDVDIHESHVPAAEFFVRMWAESNGLEATVSDDYQDLPNLRTVKVKYGAHRVCVYTSKESQS